MYIGLSQVQSLLTPHVEELFCHFISDRTGIAILDHQLRALRETVHNACLHFGPFLVGRCEEVPAIPGGVDESAWSKCTRDRSGHPPGAPQRDEVQPGYPGVTGYAWRLIGLVVTEIIGIDSYQEQSLPMRPVFEDGASDFCAVMDTEQG